MKLKRTEELEDPRRAYDVARILKSEITRELLERYRKGIMNKGSDLGGLGEYKFRNMIHCEVSVVVTGELSFSAFDKAMKANEKSEAKKKEWPRVEVHSK